MLTQGFEANRPHLRAVAYRMLGNVPDAEDAVQEAWLRLSTSDSGSIDNLGGWLTTVVSRICLNVLRSRTRAGASLQDSTTAIDEHVARTSVSPEEQAVLADSLGVALLVVLEQLSPAERICFVLHDMFSVSFDEIAMILSKSSDACRQLASRARRRVRAADDPRADPTRQRAIVDAFLVAAKSGDLQSLLSLLSPDVELVADAVAVAMGGPPVQHGPHDVAAVFSGRARAARVALIDGVAGLVWSQGGTTKVAFDFSIADDLVTKIEMIGDAEVLEEMKIVNPRRTKDN
ncbi:MAG TPA: sigma-70 family RNA polymerase sigma factor [Acidimicrobiales bacterium]